MPERTCRSCGAALTLAPPIPRDAECPNCGHDVRSCVNCRNYDVAFNNSCRETEADPVADKHHRNFCEYFELGAGPMVKADASREREAREKLERMFGGAPRADQKPGSAPETRAQAARRKLDDLFKKPDPE